MTNDSSPARFPAEWERQDAVMLVWPHKGTDWADMLEEVRACFADIIRTINDNGEHVLLVVSDCDTPEFASPLTHILHAETNDTWARDICPITTWSGGHAVFNDFKFNGWGLKFAANLDNMLTTGIWEQGVLNGEYRNWLDFVLEGGSVESDGNGLLLTTAACLLSKNRNGGSTKEQIEEYLRQALGARKILWLDSGHLEGDDTDSHIDTLARLIPGNGILYVGTDDENDPHYRDLKRMEAQLSEFTDCDGRPFTLTRLPLPNPIYGNGGERLPATYANFLIGNGFVLVPTYGQPENDEKALAVIRQRFGNSKIIGIDCNALIKQHGSLHCVTMQFPANSISL